jgi:hypothetical protein
MNGERPLVITVIRTGKHSLLVQVLVRNEENKISTWLQDTEPVLQSLTRIIEVFETMTTMDEVVLPILYPVKELRIAVFSIPGADLFDLRE